MSPAPVSDPGSAPTPEVPWERLSPLSPLLRGGVVLIGVTAWVASQLFDRFLRSIGARNPLPSGPRDIDLADALAYPWIAAGLLTGFIALVVGGAWLSWRFTRFRISAAHVELRKGWLFRQQRQVPMERVQAVEIRRTLVAQVLGLAEVMVQSAGGSDAHLKLAYLPLARATAVRTEIQRAAARPDPLDGQGPVVERHHSGPRSASGTAGAPAASGPPWTSSTPGAPGVPGIPAPDASSGEHPIGLPGDLLGLAPEGGRPVLSVPNGRLLAATVLHSSVAWVLIGGSIWLGGGWFLSSQWGSPAGFVASLPALVPAFVGLLAGRVKELLRHGNFRITDQGRALRVTHGLTDHRTTTIPLHRVQAIEMRQSLCWRPLHWWRVQVNVAGVHGDHDGVTNETVVLPVGTLDQTLSVLTLLDRELVADDLAEAARGSAREGRWVCSPPAARWIDPFAWRRRGYAVTPHCVLIRSGVLERRLVVVPHARIQSIGLHQGPVQRACGLASVHVVSTVGPIRPRIQHLAQDAAEVFLDEESGRSARARRERVST